MGLGVLAAAGMFPGQVYAADKNDMYSLSGAKYQLYADEACTAAAKDVNGKNAILVSDADGNANTLKMEPGTYYVKEVEPGTGYGLDTRVYTVKVTEANTAAAPVSFTSKEPPVYGEPNFRVFKTSTESGYADYRKLTGAEFTVKYYDVASKEEIRGAAPKDWWTFATVKKDPPSYDKDPSHYYAGFDWQTDTPVSSGRPDNSFYLDGNGKRVLPLGWFTIEETKAPGGYRITDETVYGQVRQKGTGTAAITEIEGANVHGDLIKEVVFRDEPYSIYIKKTDASGRNALAGARLQVIQGNIVKDEWVSGKEEHKIEGLPAGTYTLRELSAPYGCDIANDVTFTVTGNTDMHIVMKNSPVGLKTSAADTDTGIASGIAGPQEKITDTVHITGLHKGRKYKVTGTLMNGSTGQQIRNGSNDVSASTEFTASAEVMDVKVTFSLDSSAFHPGDKIVVFEKLFRISAVHGEKVPLELQKHEDLKDALQTITYPGISTSAADRASGMHCMLAGQESVIRDTVRYTGLQPGAAYRLEGEIYDRTAERLTGIKSSKSFAASGENGAETLTFSFDARELAGHTLVVYETLKTGDTVIAEHRDSEDAEQTICVPEIKTSAGISEDNHEIKDIVTYGNLLPDSSYVLRGWLVDTSTGEKIPGSDSSVKLTTGTKTSGSIEMILKTDNYDNMPGHSMTAFEELYIIVKENGKEKEVLAASHKDRSDKAQTVEICQDLLLKKKVTGSGGDHNKKFSFRIVFTGLVPDQSYTVEGDDTKVFNADGSGRAEVPVSLSDGQSAAIRQLPKGAQYQITEDASDHVAGFTVYSEDMADDGARIAVVSGSNEEDSSEDLSTEVETVDLFDGTVVVQWENRREKTRTPDTGDRSDMMMYAVLAGTAAMTFLALAAVRIRGKRKGA